MTLLSYATVVIILGLVIIATSDNKTCTKSNVVKGVPNGAIFKDATLLNNITFQDCIEKCCANSTCDVAGIHNKYCVMAPCKPQCRVDNFKSDKSDLSAQFIIITRTVSKNSTLLSEKGNIEKTPSKTVTDDNAVDKTKTSQPNVTKSTAEQLNQLTENNQSPPDANRTDNYSTAGSTPVKVDTGNTTNTTCTLTCPPHSSCNKNEKAFACVCDSGYLQSPANVTECVEKVTCKGDSCQEHSTCTVVRNKIECACDTGYKLKGSVCEEVSCNNVTCPIHSTCSVAKGKAHCFCEKGYIAQDEFCRKDIACQVEPENKGCPVNEQCQQVGTKTQCACVPGKLRSKGSGDCTTEAAKIQLKTNNVTITLPASAANLSVDVSPPHAKNKNYYNYKWRLQNGPDSPDTVMEGLTSSQVRLSKLIAGEYILNLDVIGLHNEYKSTAVSLTVNPAPHMNNPPVAVIKPSGDVKLKLPADFSLNGIDSHDDDKILSYKWTIEAQPTASTNNLELSGEATDTLHVIVKQGEGKFTFKLEVKDKEKLESSATKTVTILAEDDFPPSAKVSTPKVMTLPENTVALYGNGSKDDHGITRWEWQKSADSPKTADMQGTTSSVLKLSKLIEGTYTFTLTVYDKKGQNSTASTTVTVRPAVIGPPIAEAGDNKELVQPDFSTDLDGSGSSSPLGPLIHYKWEQMSGPADLHLGNETSAKMAISGMTEIGVYKFKLTVTDKNNATASDEVAVTVKKDNNKAPVAVLGPNIILYEPNTAVDIDGSNSTDDNGIVKWQWTRSPSSPALGSVVGHSDSGPVLKLCDLIVGEYTFTLTVFDKKYLSDSKSITVTVSKNPHSMDIVEVFLFENPANFTQARLDNLRNILMVPFSVDKERSVTKWTLKTIGVKSINEQVVVFFYGMDASGVVISGPPLVEHLRDTVYGKVLGYNFDVIDTSTCSNDCSSHGICNDDTRLCTCDKFWMENFFKASAGRQFSNCEWSKIYVVIIMSVIFLVFLAVMYVVWYVVSSRRVQFNKKRRYKLLEEETGRGINIGADSSDDSEYFKMKPIVPRRKSSNTNNSNSKLSNGNKIK